MEENNGIKLREIDINSILQRIRRKKKLFAITLGISFVLSSLIILCVPRYYVCSVKLAPETSNSSMGGLSSLASSFGINMSNIATEDAIIPEFYPDVMESVDYLTEMFFVEVTTKDGSLTTSYYDYILRYQKFPWWILTVEYIKKIFKKEDAALSLKESKINPFMLTKHQTNVAKVIKGKVQGKIDKKTDVLTITVEDQDPLVCATIADSAMAKLQNFIIKYRTNKAKIDLEQAQNLCNQAKDKYLKAQQKYAAFCDANEDVVLQSVKSKADELENEMQLQYNNYQITVQQIQLARAKLQERTPAFTQLQSATVPIKPAGPKRMIFVLVVMVLTFVGTYIYVLKDNK